MKKPVLKNHLGVLLSLINHKSMLIKMVLMVFTILIFNACNKEKTTKNDKIVEVPQKGNNLFNESLLVEQNLHYNIALNVKSISVAFDNLSNEQFCQLRNMLSSGLTSNEIYATLQSNPEFDEFISTYTSSIQNLQNMSIGSLTDEDYIIIGNHLSGLLGRSDVSKANVSQACKAAGNAIKTCDRYYAVCIVGAAITAGFTLGGGFIGIGLCVAAHGVCYNDALDTHYGNCPSAFRSILLNPTRNEFLTSSGINTFCN